MPEHQYSHPLSHLLHRIANALEQSNALYAGWIETQKEWREEARAFEDRLVAIHEENARQTHAWQETQMAWHEEARESEEQFQQMQVKSLKTYIQEEFERRWGQA